MVQLNLNFTHVCRHTHVLARLTHAKLQNLACACTVVNNLGMRTWDSEYTQHMRDVRTSQACTWFATLRVWCN